MAAAVWETRSVPDTLRSLRCQYPGRLGTFPCLFEREHIHPITPPHPTLPALFSLPTTPCINHGSPGDKLLVSQPPLPTCGGVCLCVCICACLCLCVCLCVFTCLGYVFCLLSDTSKRNTNLQLSHLMLTQNTDLF